MSDSPFDYLAENYDKDFTESLSGKMQRTSVWKYIENLIENTRTEKALEMGCGTGEDAIFLAKKGIQVWASDPSIRMIEIANEKARQNNLQLSIHFSQTGFENWHPDIQGMQFQLFLANFACLNCLPPDKIEAAFRKLNSHIPIGGRAILVLLPPLSVFETLGFFSRLKFRKAFRRWGPQPKKFSSMGMTQGIWYYTPKQIQKIVGSDWALKKKIPLGFFLPPGGLHSFLLNVKIIYKIIVKLETIAAKVNFLSGFSDHFLIDLEKTK